jgi:hypothetical protein
MVTRPIFHRGFVLGGNEENTIPAFKDAIAKTAGFEVDIRETKDGTLCCIHDDTWDRTTPYTGLVNGTTQAQVDTYATDGGCSIPSLLQAIKIGTGAGPVFLDKLGSGVSDFGLIRVGELVAQFAMENKSFMFSSNKDFIARFKQLVPNVRTCYRPVEVEFNIDEVQAMGVQAILPDLAVMNAYRVGRYQDVGIKVFIQNDSINSAADLDRARNLDVNGIILDAKKWKDWWS